MEKNQKVTAFIEGTTAEHQEILNTLRALIETSIPKAKEQFKWKRPVYATEKDFCYFQATKKHVTFGFTNFKKIDDHEDLLEGTGKQMRHIKIVKKEDIKPDLFSKMLQQAAVF